ncbi:hypothetical protein DPMN_021272 [Dreissena polymorpha]|uniref:Uncharacterized protein n=1 Tax=Dreissena polymorpha TaxID=45954 RepID=A0A9D4SAW8_DREPO|nr:hypothetical protein DPMN_021272 [Dreissena polymorpha]
MHIHNTHIHPGYGSHQVRIAAHPQHIHTSSVWEPSGKNSSTSTIYTYIQCVGAIR